MNIGGICGCLQHKPYRLAKPYTYDHQFLFYFDSYIHTPIPTPNLYVASPFHFPHNGYLVIIHLFLCAVDYKSLIHGGRLEQQKQKRKKNRMKEVAVRVLYQSRALQQKQLIFPGHFLLLFVHRTRYIIYPHNIFSPNTNFQYTFQPQPIWAVGMRCVMVGAFNIQDEQVTYMQCMWSPKSL